MSEEDERPACLICGERFHSVGRHVRWKHGISPREYRDRFGMRRGKSRTSTATRRRFSESFRRLIASGKLDEHLSTNASRAPYATAAGRRVLGELRNAGATIGGGSPATSRSVLAAIVAEIERGETMTLAVHNSPISWSTFHSALARHEDLADRLRAAKARRHAGTAIIGKAEARARGLTGYFTSKPCRVGHVAERKVSDGSCVECHRFGEQRRRTAAK